MCVCAGVRGTQNAGTKGGRNGGRKSNITGENGSIPTEAFEAGAKFEK